MTQPYKDFGRKLKQLREHAHKSLIEVSGAVEHDPEHMKKIEDGMEQPSEELVVLLVSHFDLEETEALGLWKLAGYDSFNPGEQKEGHSKPKAVFLPMNDAKIVYTDMVNVSANNYGVVVNFLQGLGSNSQPMAVSRVGMSIEHAQSFIKILTETVEKVSKHGGDSGAPKQLK